MFGYLDVYFTISNLVWAFCLTYTIYQIIVLEETSFEKHKKIWFFVSFILVAFLEALPFSTQSYGYNEGICQLINNEIGEIWRFSLIYAPVLIILTIIFILFKKILKKVELLGNISIKGLVFDRGLFYALIISIALIPFFVVRLVQIFDNSCLIQNFAIFLNMFSNFQGFLNGIAFFYNRSSKNRQTEDMNCSFLSGDISLRVSFSSEFSDS